VAVAELPVQRILGLQKLRLPGEGGGVEGSLGES
jgi:hypothetical protein